MHDLNLTDVKAFHGDLLSVATAGVALAGGPLISQPERGARGWFTGNKSAADVAAWRADLLTIEQRLAAASLEGQSLAQAVESDAGIAPNYLKALDAWLASERSPDSLNHWSRAALSEDRQQRRLRARWVQPLIWLGVAYCGLMFISLLIAPLFLSFSRQARIEPGIALTILLAIRAAVPIWGWVVPLLIAAWTVFLYGRKRHARLCLGTPPRLPPDLRSVGNTRCTGPGSELSDFSGLSTGVAGVLLGGVLALGLALCVFGPLVELLYGVALPRDVAMPTEVTHVGL